jgi:hypothetical protein
MIASHDDLTTTKKATGNPSDLIEPEVPGALREDLEAERRRESR